MNLIGTLSRLNIRRKSSSTSSRGLGPARSSSGSRSQRKSARWSPSWRAITLEWSTERRCGRRGGAEHLL